MTDADPEAVVARMRSMVAEWHAAQDRRAIFLDCYSRMTANMLSAISAGTFTDRSRAASLLSRFAKYYFDALAAWDDDPRRTPAPWRLAFDAARVPSTWATRDLLLGVNAHINHDLAFVVRESVGDRWEGMDADERQAAHDDFARVNDVIAATVDEVQEQVLAPFNYLQKVIAVGMGSADELIISRLVGHWRQRVWERAVMLIEARGVDEQENARQQIVVASVRIAEAILGHSGPLGAFRILHGL